MAVDIDRGQHLSKLRIVWTQVQNAQLNNLDQYRDGTAQPIVWPLEDKTGTPIYPYERARQKQALGLPA